tara:strand:+ start:1660 stop:2343 length:684 start_codon:yes stop_codon:yes gene_type:complete
MELNEMKEAWRNNDLKLEKGLQLNERCMEVLLTNKVTSNLGPLYWHRLIEVLLHLICIGLLLVFMVQNRYQFPYAASALALLLMYAVLTYSALKQLKLLLTIDYSKDLATVQKTLVLLQTHIVNYSRLSVLFIPAFLAYPTVITEVIKDYDITLWAHFDIIRQSNGAWWTVQLLSLLVLVPLGIWFYGQVSFKHMDKKWVRDYISKMTGVRISKALEFLREVEDLRK